MVDLKTATKTLPDEEEVLRALEKLTDKKSSHLNSKEVITRYIYPQVFLCVSKLLVHVKTPEMNLKQRESFKPCPRCKKKIEKTAISHPECGWVSEVTHIEGSVLEPEAVTQDCILHIFRLLEDKNKTYLEKIVGANTPVLTLNGFCLQWTKEKTIDFLRKHFGKARKSDENELGFQVKQVPKTISSSSTIETGDGEFSAKESIGNGEEYGGIYRTAFPDPEPIDLLISKEKAKAIRGCLEKAQKKDPQFFRSWGVELAGCFSKADQTLDRISEKERVSIARVSQKITEIERQLINCLESKLGNDFWSDLKN